ncbi:MAG: hypothetical protein PSY12_06500, partial [bacterium]|nr:hypothetical protein [bacterium]
MLIGMNAYPSPAGSTLADGWPMTRVMVGLSAVPVEHAIDLAFLFPMEGRARPDALIAETRRHMGGCVRSIETALRLSLEDAVGAALAQLDDPLCWPMMCAQPTLFGPALIAHMQTRAGISMMLRQFGRSDGEAMAERESDAMGAVDGSALGDAVSILALAEARWLMTIGEDEAMRPDLPAEHFAELVWTVAACLAAAVQRMGLYS